MKHLSFITFQNERERVVVKTSLLGIGANLLLAAFKALVGVLANSFAVVIDAVNNLSDALSSLITIIGTKLAGRKADSNHPLGHGRIEYFTTLLVSIIILYAGFTALIESVKKIIQPQAADYSALTLVIIASAIVVKLILGTYVKKKGREVNSDALTASGSDALFDAILSSSVLASAIVFLLSGLNLEAYVGVLISLFIIKSGFEMLKDTVEEMIGRRVPREIVEAVKGTIGKDAQVEGVYDVILHSYGPERYVGSAHVSVPDTMSAREIDEMERRISEKVYQEQGILMTGIGIYAVDSGEAASVMRQQVSQIVTNHEGVLQIHGFYADTEKKIIQFDVVLDFALPDRQEAMAEILRDVQAAYPDYDIRPVMDLDI